MYAGQQRRPSDGQPIKAVAHVFSHEEFSGSLKREDYKPSVNGYSRTKRKPTKMCLIAFGRP